MAKTDVLVRMKADTTGYNANIAKARKTLEGFKNDNLTLGGILSQTTRSLTAAAAGYASLAAAAGAIKQLVSESVKLAKEGEGVRLAFERLNNPQLLDKLNEATHNTVSNIELMKAAVKFNDFKLPVEELGLMLAFAQKKAKDTGQSIDYMVESITNGLGRQSKPILDNLGISAKEIEERMKSTGDFTKAVGEIIREQMSKAGEYVETASDRAAQADKRLKDSMEALGRTFQPLADAASSMWNDIKVGAIVLLNSAVRPLIDALTEAGRIRSQFEKQGGNVKVKRQLEFLGGIYTKEYRQNIYQAQLSKYDTKIGSYEQYLKDYKKWQGDKTSVDAYDRMQAFQKQTRLSMYSDVKEQLEVFKKRRSEYVTGAKSILEGNPAPPPTDTTNNKGGSAKTPKTEEQLINENIQKLTQEYIKASNDRQAAIRNEIKGLQDQLAVIQQLKDEATGKKAVGGLEPVDIPAMPFSGFTDQTAILEESKNAIIETIYPLQQMQEELKRLQEEQAKAWTPEQFAAYQTAIENVQGQINQFKGIKKDAKEAANGFNEAATAINSVVGALNAMEDPSLRITGIIGQAIAQIALGFAQATAADSKYGVFRWIAAITGGMATMISTISAIHSATGYAQGGIVDGKSYSGDNVPIMANAGELVLTRSMQNNLARQLQDNGNGKGYSPSYISGEQIYIALNRYMRRTGRSEIVTWK